MNLRTKAIEAAQQALGALSSRKKAERVVDAVLAAIREPDDEMLQASGATADEADGFHVNDVASAYIAMMDAMLEKTDALTNEAADRYWNSEESIRVTDGGEPSFVAITTPREATS